MDLTTSLPSGTLTFLFTDIEGSTRLWQEHADTMPLDLARHDAILRTAIEANHGQVFKTIGDGFCAVFPSALDAVQASLEVQRQLLSDTGRPQGGPLRVRMAVHTGAAEMRDGDYFGPALSRVARLLAAGHGGQVLLSRTSAEQIRCSLHDGTSLRPLGEHRLKDLAGKEAIFQLQSPDLPASFPPLNTLDIAFRRGMVRAAAVASFVLVIVAGLALLAWNNARREARQRQRVELLLYAAHMNLAQQALEAGDLGRAEELVEAHRPGAGQTDLRGFEWGYLRALCHSDDQYTFRDFADPVSCVAFSPDGKTLATSSGPLDSGGHGQVKLWDVASHRELATFPGHSGWSSCIAFSPDGRLLATGGQDKIVRLWDLRTRRQLVKLAGYTGWVGLVGFSPDSRTLATASGSWALPDSQGEVKLWDIATHREVSILKAQHPLLPVAFSPDFKMVAATGNEHDSDLWNPFQLRGLAAVRRPIGTFRGHNVFLAQELFSPDGRILAAGAWDGSITLWSARSRQTLAVLAAHKGFVDGIAFSPDGKTLATGGEDGMIRLWDVRSRRELATLHGHTGIVRWVAFSPDGRTLASAGGDRTVRLWDTRPKPETDVLRGHTAMVTSVAVSPDGRTVATSSEDKTARLWDSATGREIARLKGHSHFVWWLAFSPDGKTLATASWDKTVKLWDVATRRELATLNGHQAPLFIVAFSPDGKILATGSTDKTAKLWDVATRRELATLKGHHDVVIFLAFSPDGRTLVTSSTDGTMRLWDLATKRCLATLKDQSLVMPVAYSPDGMWLVTGTVDGTVGLWDTATRRRVTSLRAHKGATEMIAFSPDGKTMATGGDDQTVKLWNTATNQEVAVLKGHKGAVVGLAFSPNGRFLASGSGDKTARIWRAASFHRR